MNDAHARLLENGKGDDKKERLYRAALALAWITVFYNMAEGVVSVFFGLDDETLALFGFGVDSFVEVISGIGILHLVRNIRNRPDENPDPFERKALRITGTAFYLLTGGLTITAVYNLLTGHGPETTFWGIVVSLISIMAMWALIHFKVKVGRQLGSDAILADANCTKTCLYLSFVLLLASAGYEMTGIGRLDSLGAAAIAVFAFREGREAFEKAEGKACCSNCR